MSYSKDFLPDPTFMETKSLKFLYQQNDEIQFQECESSIAGMEPLYS